MDFQLPEYVVNVEDLQVGVYVKIKDKWFKHPFIFQHFKIKNQSQIEVLKSSGILQVICVPSKCDQLPLVPKKIDSLSSQQKDEGFSIDSSQVDELWAVKKKRILLLKEKKIQMAKTQASYNDVLQKIPLLMKNVFACSDEALRETTTLVDDIAATFLKDTDTIVHLMDCPDADETFSIHSLNVTVLALMTGKSAKLSAEEMHHLGIGSFLHDLGKSKIEKKILRKKAALTKPESEIFKLHTAYGAEIVDKFKSFPYQASKIITQHHELLNGEGYPLGLKGSAISDLSMITAIANIFDTLCNPVDASKALLPHHALSLMFTKFKNLLDTQLFTYFVRSVGIYPPGSVVQLSNDAVGMVISINSKNPLKPNILLYDPFVPKEEALTFWLDEEPDLAIVKCISPQKIPQEIFNYLDPKPKMHYFPESNNEIK
jgi:HD-GYP domain-containing protein (c-di-GMP phosphodiesterase class II)